MINGCEFGGHMGLKRTLEAAEDEVNGTSTSWRRATVDGSCAIPSDAVFLPAGRTFGLGFRWKYCARSVVRSPVIGLVSGRVVVVPGNGSGRVNGEVTEESSLA